MPTATTQLEENLKEAQKALKAVLDENDAIAASVKTEDGTFILEQAQKDAFQTGLAKARDLRATIELLEEQKGVRSWASAPASDPAALAAGVAAHLQQSGLGAREAKTLGQLFVESDEFKALGGGKNALTMPVPFSLNVKDLAGFNHKDVYTALPTGTPGSFGRIERAPIVERAHRTLRVRDLFNVRQTTALTIEYFQITGFTNNASVIPERTGDAFTAKPQSNLSVVGQTTSMKTIAHWEVAHRNVLSDEPQLRGIIDNELLYGLQLHEDYQILQGTGTSEDLLGILNTPNVQTYSETTVATDEPADAVRRAITKVLLADYEATGVVLHPGNWEDIELTKDSTGGYITAVSVAAGAPPTVWRLPVVQTAAIPENTGLVGAFGLGVQLFDREEANIRISESHSDFFVRNAVVILAEERLGLTVPRPESMVIVTFES